MNLSSIFTDIIEIIEKNTNLIKKLTVHTIRIFEVNPPAIPKFN